MSTPPICLTIAGSDSSAGAGIQADLKTFAALNCYGVSVITAITAQNTTGVQHIENCAPALVGQQLHALTEDFAIRAVKTGMLASAEIIAELAGHLPTLQPAPLVIDPVLCSSHGQALLPPHAVNALKTKLLPHASLITPNLAEATLLTGLPISSPADMEQAGRTLLDAGAGAVLVKGGHGEGTGCDDLLLWQSSNEYHHKWFTGTRVHTTNTHGTGCTLSAAIATGLAHGYALPEAVERAKRYVSASLRAAANWQLGQGTGPLNHFHSFRTEE